MHEGPLIERCNAVVDLAYEAADLNSPRGRVFGAPPIGETQLRLDDPPRKASIVIVGAGMVGVGLACLLSEFHDWPEGVVLIGGHDHLFEPLFSIMERLGQRVMRSSYEHQIAPDRKLQLLDFARLHAGELTERERVQVRLGIAGQRSIVPADLFMAHCRHVAVSSGIPRLAFRFPVEAIERDASGNAGWIIRDRIGRRMAADAVVLATGSSPQRDLVVQSARRTLLPYDTDLSFDRGQRVAVVGSGLTAGHVLSRCVESGATATWFLRQREQYRCADFDTSYFRTEGLQRFRSLSQSARLQVLERERRGSLMPEMAELVRQWTNSGAVRQIVADQLQPAATAFADFDIVVVATGTAPNGSLISKSAGWASRLYPLVDDGSLEVLGCAKLYAAGALASYGLGPAARTIDGARLAAQRIIPSLRSAFGLPIPATRFGSAMRGTFSIGTWRSKCAV